MEIGQKRRGKAAPALFVAVVVVMASLVAAVSVQTNAVSSSCSTNGIACTAPQAVVHWTGPRIAFIKPVFTATAYSSFYRFYALYAKIPVGQKVYTNLGLLNATLVDGWGNSGGVYTFLTSNVAKSAGILIGKNAFVLTDVDVDQGKLFSANGSRLFDVAVLAFSEYVTAAEYNAFKHFVQTGGRLIVLSATTFLAEVSYNRAANKVALVGGNTWYFNGQVAWKGTLGQWVSDNTNWVGSNYRLFFKSENYTIHGAIANTSDPYSWALRKAFGSTIFTDYKPHEENVVTNSTDRIIAYWNVKSSTNYGTVAVYEHPFGKGEVIHFGAFGGDFLATSRQVQYFLLTTLGLLGVLARSYQVGCFLKLEAWPAIVSWSSLNITSAYALIGGKEYRMSTTSPTLYTLSAFWCSSKPSAVSILMVASNLTAGIAVIDVRG